MLKFFRKHARGWFMTAVIAIIIVVFVLYFGGGVGGRQANTIATVDKKIITENDLRNEYDKLLEMARLNFGDKLTADMLKQMDLKTKAYNNIINREVIIAKASDLKIQVSDEELRNHIMSMPALQTDGIFDERKYQRILRLNRLTAEDFESFSKSDLIAGKIESLVREGVKISDKEIYDLYALQHRMMNIYFLRVTATDLKHKISPSQSELEDYLKRNSNLFRVADQISVRYLFFGADSFSSDISDADIKNYYASHRENFKSKEGKQLSLGDVRLSIAGELKRARSMESAFSAARKARDEIYQDDHMDEYGRTHNLRVHQSDFFSMERIPAQLASVNNISNALMDMQKGELSKVLSAPYGYYLLQVVDKKPSYLPSLAAIEKDVKNRFVESEAGLMAQKEANRILERLTAGESIEKVAAEKGLKIHQTGFFQPGNTVPQIGQSPDLVEVLIQLSEGKPYPEKPITINNVFFILKFKDATKPDERNFEAQKNMYRQILTSLKQEEAFQAWLEGNKTAMMKEKRLRIKKQLENL